MFDLQTIATLSPASVGAVDIACVAPTPLPAPHLLLHAAVSAVDIRSDPSHTPPGPSSVASPGSSQHIRQALDDIINALADPGTHPSTPVHGSTDASVAPGHAVLEVSTSGEVRTEQAPCCLCNLSQTSLSWDSCSINLRCTSPPLCCAGRGWVHHDDPCPWGGTRARHGRRCTWPSHAGLLPVHHGQGVAGTGH